MSRHEADPEGLAHSSHWGAFRVVRQADGIGIRPFPDGAQGSPLLGNIPASVDHPARTTRPLVRKGWLENGPGPDSRRGSDSFVALEWDDALDLIAAELKRVAQLHGSEAIFGGSYGWSSAGRFHHAQSQVHRFLNLCMGGYTRSVNDYSSGAGLVLFPHIIAPQELVTRHSVVWDEIVEHNQLVLAFGGIPSRNTDVGGGGSSQHIAASSLRAHADRGGRVVSVSPLRDDIAEHGNVRWLPIRPETDTAMLLAIAHVLESEGLADRAFLARFCTGYDAFRRYLLGGPDGLPKTPAWAAAICGIAETDIVALAHDLAASASVISVTYSLQRAEHGEQPLWAALAVAAMLGQMGRKGCGFSYGLGSSGNNGKRPLAISAPALSQASNSVETYIPVARIADMLLSPGKGYAYNGKNLAYPDIRLVYWAGGNPFHHHQDLQRLTRAFARPETIIVHDPFFTATANHADFVIPSTISLEREDFGASRGDPLVVAMRQTCMPLGEARDDYSTFSQLARRLGCEDAFTEGRDAEQWLRHLYGQLQQSLADHGLPAPDFDRFRDEGSVTLPLATAPGLLERFLTDPLANPLPTPSGRIVLFSQTVADFGYADCPGHPAWIEPDEWLGAGRARIYPLQLVANQPATRLHSQLDFGKTSQDSKRGGREPVRIHPRDAADRGIGDGALVRLFNDRGSCLASAVLSEAVMPGVVQIATGAWYQPVDLPGIGTTCVHGNPNILTRDIGTSHLGQACTGQLCLVEIEAFAGDAPPVTVHRTPQTDAARPADVEARIAELRAAIGEE